jgi:hypothetical protein
MKLSAYQLACGSIERKVNKTGSVTLWREHGTYHVKRISYFIDGRPIQDAWLCPETLKAAHRAYKRQCDILEATS